MNLRRHLVVSVVLVALISARDSRAASQVFETKPAPVPSAFQAVNDLTLDGNLAEDPGPWTDFTLAAIHFANVSDGLVRGVTVRGSVGDGIGVQSGRDNRVESCLVENCRENGLWGIEASGGRNNVIPATSAWATPRTLHAATAASSRRIAGIR